MKKEQIPDSNPAFDQHYGGGMDSEIINHDSREEDKYMHNPGEFFWNALGNHLLIHILESVGNGYDPADIKCEEYAAVCGAESQSWSMPSKGVPGAEFGTVEEGIKAGAKKCPDCFPEEKPPFFPNSDDID
jgi:hypothetical protein